MKKIFFILTILFGIFLIILILPKEQITSVENQPIPVEPDGGIGDGAEPLDEFQGEAESEDITGFRKPLREICVGEYCDGSMSGEDDFTVVNIPLIGSDGDIGCGSSVFLAPHVVEPKTSAVLDATYQALFQLKAESEIEADNINNIVAQEDRLFYQGVSLQDGTAELRLEGLIYKIAHCAVPEFRAQIEQSALQFDSVDTLEVYLNGERWDWCEYSDADPQESGCDTEAKYWIAT